MVTDEDVARLIAANLLPSPFPFHNSVLIKIRVSGTGVSYRRKHDEYVYRNPRLYLSRKFCDRVRGVPLVEDHPDAQVLDGETLVSSICGILVYGFPEDGELKAIARIFDKRVAAILEAGSYDTSPAVINPDGVMLQIGDDKLYAENEPAVIDHVALIDTSEGNKGVWNKDGDNLGVEITEVEGSKQHAN